MGTFEQIRILFVCHGNICRSPMAEFVMRAMVKHLGRQDEFVIASAATSTEEIGNPVHRGTQKRLAQEGISCKGKTARQITPADYESYDYLIGMDHANVRSMERAFHGDPDNKISLLLHYANIDRDIADPWYTRNFDATYDDVVCGCKALLRHIDAESR